MVHIHANLSASISELKANPTALLNKANGEAIVILNHNKPAAYMIPAEAYEAMLNALENFELLEVAKVRLKEKSEAISVDLDDL